MLTFKDNVSTYIYMIWDISDPRTDFSKTQDTQRKNF